MQILLQLPWKKEGLEKKIQSKPLAIANSTFFKNYPQPILLPRQKNNYDANPHNNNNNNNNNSTATTATATTTTNKGTVTRFVKDVEWEKRRDKVKRNKTNYVLTFKIRHLIYADCSMILHHLLIMFSEHVTSPLKDPPVVKIGSFDSNRTFMILF